MAIAGLLLLSAAPAPAQDPKIVAIPSGEAAKGAAAERQAARTRLRLDDGSQELVLSLTDEAGSKAFQIVVLNRFTPTSNRLPLALETILVLLPKTCQLGDTNLRPEMTFEALVYLDPSGSGDPANAMLVARQPFQVRPSDRRFQRIQLETPVTVTGGDVWVGYTNSFSAADDRPIYHAALDTTRSRGRSWIFYNTTLTSFTGSVLSDAQVRRTIDEEGVPGNWMIRARGRIAGGATSVDVE